MKIKELYDVIRLIIIVIIFCIVCFLSGYKCGGYDEENKCWYKDELKYYNPQDTVVSNDIIDDITW